MQYDERIKTDYSILKKRLREEMLHKDVNDGHQKQDHVSMPVCAQFVRGNKIIETASCDSHVLSALWPAWIYIAFGRGLTCLAWVGSGTSLGPDPTATLAHICHSRPGEEVVLSEARPDTQH